MDSLDSKTLYKLYEYVKKTTAPKRKKPAPKKVKVQYSEADATKKITELERTLQKFEQPAPHVKGRFRSSACCNAPFLCSVACMPNDTNHVC